MHVDGWYQIKLQKPGDQPGYLLSAQKLASVVITDDDELHQTLSRLEVRSFDSELPHLWPL